MAFNSFSKQQLVDWDFAVPIVALAQQLCGEETTMENPCAMHVGFILNSMALIAHLRCEKMEFKRAKENQKKLELVPMCWDLLKRKTFIIITMFMTI